MADGIPKESELQRAIDAFTEAFPESRCLRCGHDKFFALPVRRARDLRPHTDDDRILDIACRRCGFVESHVLGLLSRADKPIPDPGSADTGS